MSIPSLRQKQINEVLNYHRLMDRTVFDRNVRSVHASEQTRSEPHRTDIETEANLRERVDKMKTTLQQLIQVSSYDEDGIDPSTSGETMEGRTLDVSAAFMKNKVDSTLASLLSDYNGICQLYDSKNRAKVFSQSEGNALIGIVKELKDPLVEAIGKLMQYKDQTKKYFQTYRVLKTLIDNIESAPPLIKIPVSLLTEPYFIPNPTKVKPVDTPLWRHLLESRDEIASKIEEYTKVVTSNATEKQAQEKTISSLRVVADRIKSLINANEKAMSSIDNREYAAAMGNFKSLKELKNSPYATPSIKKSITEVLEGFRNAYENAEDFEGQPLELEWFMDIWGEDPKIPRDRREILPYPTEFDRRYDESTERYEEELDAINNAIASTFREIKNIKNTDAYEDKSDPHHRMILRRLKDTEDALKDLRARKASATKAIKHFRRREVEESKVPVPERESKDDIPDTVTQDSRPMGKGKSKKGGNNNYGDDSVLEPYLSKHLKPSKFHEKIKPVESSSEESETDSESDMDPDHVSSSDESEPEVGGFRKKRHSKKVVNPNTLVKQGKEGVALLEKIMAKPRGGRKKVVKPLVNNNRDKDMWFM